MDHLQGIRRLAAEVGRGPVDERRQGGGGHVEAPAAKAEEATETTASPRQADDRYKICNPETSIEACEFRDSLSSSHFGFVGFLLSVSVLILTRPVCRNDRFQRICNDDPDEQYN